MADLAEFACRRLSALRFSTFEIDKKTLKNDTSSAARRNRYRRHARHPDTPFFRYARFHR